MSRPHTGHAHGCFGASGTKSSSSSAATTTLLSSSNTMVSSELEPSRHALMCDCRSSSEKAASALWHTGHAGGGDGDGDCDGLNSTTCSCPRVVVVVVPASPTAAGSVIV